MTKYEIKKEILYLLNIIKNNMNDNNPISKDLTKIAYQVLIDFFKDNETTINTLSSDFITPLLNILAEIKKLI